MPDSYLYFQQNRPIQGPIVVFKVENVKNVFKFGKKKKPECLSEKERDVYDRIQRLESLSLDDEIEDDFNRLIEMKQALMKSK